MRKLYLLLDDWDNDRNFVGGELKLIREKYDVTVICDSAKENMETGVRYLVYDREPGIAGSILKMLFDRDLWAELVRAAKYRSDTGSGFIAHMSEAVRFYIKADMFRCFMKENDCFVNGAIYYSYWNFRKCYAVTHNIEKYKDYRIISRIHGYELYDEQIPSGYQPFKVSMDRMLDKLVFISEQGKDYYLNKYGKMNEEKYELRLLGSKSPREKSKGCVKKENDPVKLVSCSRIDRIKRVERIVEALALIDDFKISWVHFGDGILADEVKKLAKNLLDPMPNIEYDFRGQTDNDAIHEYYASEYNDAFITSSSSEGNPVSVMEAMSYGIPVIAPSICNFPNMIGDCGILTDTRCDKEELAEAIRRLKNLSEEETTVLRHKVYERWDERYNADKNDRRFVEEVLDRL